LIYLPGSSSKEKSIQQPYSNLFADKFKELSTYNSTNSKPECFENPNNNSKIFEEGILYTRVSYPGNILNDLLSGIDFSKNNIQDQIRNLQQKTNSTEYAEEIQKKMSTLSEEEKTAMGKMMMGIMFSPLYAKIYVSKKEVLAKTTALNYTMESYMDIQNEKGRMNVLSNNSAEKAAIQFSAKSMKEVWEKEEVGPSKYNIKAIPGTTNIAGYPCSQTIYTYKTKTPLQKAPYKLIVWHSNEIGKEINFFHPFYFEIDKGILKIEVQYDHAGKVKMVYEVTGSESKKLSGTDFQLTSINPVLNWDTNQAEASMKILQAMMSSNE
jgi:hypothetical protein